MTSPFRERLPFSSPEELPFYVWGKTLWLLGGHYSRPDIPHDPCEYIGQVRLSRLHDAEPHVEQSATPGSWFLDGDSDFGIGSLQTIIRTFTDGRVVTMVPVQNYHGRLAGFAFYLKGVTSVTKAYHAIRDCLNFVSIRIAIAYQVPIRPVVMRFYRAEDGDQFILARCPYPVQRIDWGGDMPVIVNRLFARYLDGVRSGSPIYSLIVFFEFNRFLMEKLQPVLRKIASESSIPFEEISGSYAYESVRYIGDWLAGTSYSDYLSQVENTRNQLVHSFLDRGFRPFNSIFEDRIALESDFLRLMSLDLITKVLENFANFVDAGIDLGYVYQQVRVAVADIE